MWGGGDESEGGIISMRWHFIDDLDIVSVSSHASTGIASNGSGSINARETQVVNITSNKV